MESLQAIDDGGADRDVQTGTMPAIGTDERRMHVRAYNAWVSLLRGRPLPSIADLDPESSSDFGPHSVLLDFTQSTENPAVGWLGKDLRVQCEADHAIATIADVPRGSLLSRLTDHYLQIIANRAPIGFEAEFTSRQEIVTLYRGILLPFTSNGTTIDFIYGVINWKEVAAADYAPAHEPAPALPAALIPAVSAWADGPNAGPAAFGFAKDVPDGYGAFDETDDEAGEHTEAMDFDEGLADRLAAARETAELVRSAEGRSRACLYRALGLAYDFSLAADAREEDYQELLLDAGIKVQERAPMTAVVKLIFGADYDKTRLTEFAAALSYGRRTGIEAGALGTMLERQSGGLKGIVQAERSARRPETKRDTAEIARAALRRAEPRAVLTMAAGDGEFVLLIARREADGTLAVIAPVPEDQPLIDRAVRRITA